MITVKRLFGLLLCCVPALAAMGIDWDEQTYRQIEQRLALPTLGDAEYLVGTFGAKPENTARQNQRAIQRAIDKCSKRGGGRVVIPAGQTIATGALELKSGVNLVIGEGARLQFVFQPELYPIVETSWEGLDCFNLSPCIYAHGATDIAITGSGAIDGGGSAEAWWPWVGKERFGWREGMQSQAAEARPRLLRCGEDGVPMRDAKGRPTAARTFTAADGLRPQLIGLNECQRVLVEDVTLLDSPFWVIHPLKCQDVTVRRVHINNDGPNGDGCDPESCDRVLIEDCFFNTGDDCIAIKSGRNRDGRERAMPSQNIIIRRCQMKNGHGGVVIGSEISGGCRNVFAHDCTMDSPQLDRVLRIKTNTCRGGVIERIFVKDIQVGQCAESVLKINLDYEPREVCCRGNNPTVRRVLMQNVSCQQSKYGVQIIGLADTTCVSDITVRQCRFDGVEQGNTITGRTQGVQLEQLFLNGSLVLKHMPFKHYSEWMTRSEMKRTPKPYLLDFAQKPRWNYVLGIELEGMLDTYLRYGGDDIRRYCQEYTDTMINARGEIRGYSLQDYNLDNIRPGHFVTRMYQHWPEAKNLLAMQTMMRQLEQQPRTVADHVYWHKAIYAYQVWLDGIFMGLPFRCLTAPITAASATNAIYDDATDQLKTTYERTLDPATGLNRHAYDETRQTFWADPQTGLSQHCWARAQGWFTMALIEVLDALPDDYARRQELVDLLQKDLDAVLRWQDGESGVWCQVMDVPAREGRSAEGRSQGENYLEATASCMFAYALLKAARKGYVGDGYRDAGIRAYQGIVREFVRVGADSTISLANCCSVAGLGPAATPQVVEAMRSINPKGTVKENRRRDGSYEYYLSEPIRDNDAKGIGPFLWASLEMEQLGYDTGNTMQPLATVAKSKGKNPLRETSRDFFRTDEARRIGNQVLAYQRATGGWPKNIDMARQLSDDELQQVLADKGRTDDSTTDNSATTMQMTFLARLYRETADTLYRDAFRRGVDYLLSGQYENGGWPQFWPTMRDYQVHITYNDDAMVNTLILLRRVAEGKGFYGRDLTTDGQKQRMRQAFDRGIACILATQIVWHDELTVWCQQHDRETLLPAPARKFELASFCSQESAAIVQLLMELPQPDERVKTAVRQAMKWFDEHQLRGVRVEEFTNADGKRDRRLVSDPQAPPLWARYYDLEHCQPFVCDRDGVPRQHLEDLSYERRVGYSWYNSRPAELYPLYEQWKKRVGE